MRIDLGNRVIDAAGAQLILMDSATSDVARETPAWLDAILQSSTRSILFTHVTLHTKAVVEFPSLSLRNLRVDPLESRMI